MRILNLGCGTRTSPRCVNIDWSIYLRLRKNRAANVVAQRLLAGERRTRFDGLADDIVVHDLRRGIPAADASCDAVYHSHVLEHLDREHVAGFLGEIRRVLRPGGMHRVVVPDLEKLARLYLADLDACVAGTADGARHDDAIAVMIEQMVRRESFGSSQRPPFARAAENALLGDARRRGETHQWMYDRVNLEHTLTRAGFRDVRVLDHLTSAIPEWDHIGLDRAEDDGEYIPDSLYVECVA